MSHSAPDPVAARLRFAVDDYAEAGRTFAAWRAHGRDADLEQAQLWAYAYLRRYLVGRFARERMGGPSDLEASLSRAFRKVLGSFERIRDPALFAHYVSVAARHELLSHRERRRVLVEYDETMAEGEDAPDAGEALDRPLIRRTVEAAIADLPAALRGVAEMRLLGGLSYEDIAANTGYALPTVRTYLSKAVHRLREAPGLRLLYTGDPDDA